MLDGGEAGGDAGEEKVDGAGCSGGTGLRRKRERREDRRRGAGVDMFGGAFVVGFWFGAAAVCWTLAARWFGLRLVMFCVFCIVVCWFVVCVRLQQLVIINKFDVGKVSAGSAPFRGTHCKYLKLSVDLEFLLSHTNECNPRISLRSQSKPLSQFKKYRNGIFLKKNFLWSRQ